MKLPPNKLNVAEAFDTGVIELFNVSRLGVCMKCTVYYSMPLRCKVLSFEVLVPFFTRRLKERHFTVDIPQSRWGRVLK